MSGAMQEEVANLYQLMYQVTIVVTFQVKSFPDLTLTDFVD